MSDYESYKGTIKKIEREEGESLADQCKRICISRKGDKLEYYEGLLFDEFYDDYLKINGELWEVVSKKAKDPDDSYCDIESNEDGTFSFNTRFYNGGTCLTEMIEDAIKEEGIWEIN